MRRSLPLLMLAGCLSQEELPIELPADADFVAAITASEDGFLVGSPLLRVEDGALSRPLPATIREDQDLYFVTYSEAELDGVQVPIAELRDGNLVEANACDDALPAPGWVRIKTGDEPLQEAELPFTLAHSQVRNSCPQTRGEIAGVIDGDSAPCFPTSTQEQCEIEIDLASCSELPKVSGVVRTDGRLCLTPPATCSSTQENSVNCGDRTVFLSECSQKPTIEEISVGGALQVEVPHSARASAYLHINGLYSGTISDFILLEDRVVIASYANASGDTVLRNVACRPVEGDLDFIPRMNFHVHDLETLSLLETVAAPPCLVKMQRDPFGDGFIALFRDDAGGPTESEPIFAVGRFDASGTLETKVVLPVDLAAEGRNAFFYYNVRDTVLSADGRELFVLIDAPASGNLYGRVYAIDTQTLSPLRASEPLDSFDLVSMVVRGDRLHLLSGAIPPVLLSGDTTALRFTDAAVGDLNGFPLHLADVDPQLLIFEGGIDPAAVFVDGGIDARVSIVAVGSSAVSTTTRWSKRPGRLIGAALRRANLGGNDSYDIIGQRGAALVDLDLTSRQFDACDVQLGLGPVTRMREDGAQRLWVLLPWEGRLLRLTE